MIGVTSPFNLLTVKKANGKRKLVITPVTVEKLFSAKFAKMKLRQDAI